jgi:site-specific recombinase XerD
MARRAPLPVLQQLMGHEEVSTTMRYVDVAEADKRAAITTVFGRGSHVAASADARG